MSVPRAAAEWRRAQDSLAASRLCQENGLYADAISSAYYSVMHAAKASLELRGVTAQTHAGVRNSFGRRIVSAGLVEGRWGREIGLLSDLRLVADYNAQATFTEPDGSSAYERAEAFLDRIRSIITDAIPSE